MPPVRFAHRPCGAPAVTAVHLPVPIPTHSKERQMKSKHVQYPGVAGRGGLALTPVLAAGAVLLLAACAGTPPGGVAGAEECVYVRVTGSNLPVKECRSREEREAIAAANEQAV